MRGKFFPLFLFLALLLNCCHKCPENTALYTSIPLFYSSSSDSPLLQVEIERKIYTLMLDLGSASCLALQRAVLEKIENKKLLDYSKIFDIKGNSYTVQQFSLPIVKIRNIEMKNVVAEEQPPSFVSSGTKVWPPPKKCYRRSMQQLAEIDGRLGIELFQKQSCFLDLPHSRLLIAKDPLELQKICTPQKFISIPFEIKKGLVVICAKTDLGSKNLLLDTGASISLLKESHADKALFRKMETGLAKWTSPLILGERSFGKWDFWLFEFSERLYDIDGILGIPFFKKHAIYLDFQHQIAYIQISSR